MGAETNGARRAVTPTVRKKVQRRAAMTEALLLHWSEFVERGGNDRASGHVASAAVPGQEAGLHVPREPKDDVRGKSVAGPDTDVRRDEDPCRRDVGVLVPCPCCVDVREREDHRRDRGKHHRPHHRHPDADEAREPAEIGTRPCVHSADQGNRQRPRRQRRQRKQR